MACPANAVVLERLPAPPRSAISEARSGQRRPRMIRGQLARFPGARRNAARRNRGSHRRALADAARVAAPATTVPVLPKAPGVMRDEVGVGLADAHVLGRRGERPKPRSAHEPSSCRCRTRRCRRKVRSARPRPAGCDNPRDGRAAESCRSSPPPRRGRRASPSREVRARQLGQARSTRSRHWSRP